MSNTRERSQSRDERDYLHSPNLSDAERAAERASAERAAERASAERAAERASAERAAERASAERAAERASAERAAERAWQVELEEIRMRMAQRSARQAERQEAQQSEESVAINYSAKLECVASTGYHCHFCGRCTMKGRRSDGSWVTWCQYCSGSRNKRHR
jgi:hypothetical protein